MAWVFGQTTKILHSTERSVRWDDGNRHGTVLVDVHVDFDNLTEEQKIAYVEAKIHVPN